MGTPLRSTRSSAAPAGRRNVQSEEALKRPKLHVVEATSTETKSNGWQQLVHWTKTRTAPLAQIVFAVVFLLASMLGALVLRTQMVQNSFESTQIQQNIIMLQQDVEADQTKLDSLEASLPEKAQKLKMQPSTSSKTIDLQGYKAPKEGGR